MRLEYRIRRCLLADIRRISGDLRAQDRSEIDGFGLSPRRALFHCWQQSPTPRVAEIAVDERWRPAAVWGDEGALLDPLGRAWLFTAPIIERVPLAFFREARRQIRERLQVRHRLISSVRADYSQALRFFALLGFQISEALPQPPNGVLYHEIEIGRD